MSIRHCPVHAFTLLEVLVVVAVIGLLLAILMPALSAANEAGRAAVGGTNLNQLGIGSFRYSQSNDSSVPWLASIYRERRAVDEEWWPTQIARGMEQFEPQVYACPGDPMPYGVPVYLYSGVAYMNDVLEYIWDKGSSMKLTPNERPKRAEHAGGTTIWLQVSYRGSCGLVERVGDAYWTRKVTSWAQPDKAIELAEGIADSPDMECFHYGFLVALSTHRGPAGRPVRDRYRHYDTWLRHFGATNVLHLDGHVSAYASSQLGELALIQETNEQ